MNFRSYYEAPIVWHVIFHPKGDWWWWPGKFRHVSLAGYCNDTWLHIDLGRGGASICPIYHYQEIEDYLSYMLHHYTVLRVPDAPRKPSASRFLLPMSCVSLATHILGLPNRALLPDGLYRNLLKNHSAVVVPNENQNASRNV